jgi:hypothetical protein
MYNRRELFTRASALVVTSVSSSYLARADNEEPKVLAALYSVRVQGVWKLRVGPASCAVDFGDVNLSRDDLFGWEIFPLSEEERTNLETRRFGSVYLTQKQADYLGILIK